MAAVAQTRGFAGAGNCRNKNRGESFSRFGGDSPREAITQGLPPDSELATFALHSVALRILFFDTLADGRHWSAHPLPEVGHEVHAVACI